MTRNALLTLRKRLRAWLSRWKTAPEDESELRAFADRAYAHCVAWFGQPVDPKRPYVLIRGRNWSRCSPGWKCYFLVISDRCKTREQWFAAVAHEMFHRISWRNGGSIRYQSGQAWLEELLACLTCGWVLENEGSSYAVTRRNWYFQRPNRVNTRKLRTFDSRLFRFCLTLGIVYPKHFYNSVNRLGYALYALTGREPLCRLAQSHSLEAWIDSLPTGLQAPTSYILGTCQEKPTLTDATAHHRFSLALAAIGEWEGAIVEVQKCIRLEPSQTHFYHTLGHAYYGLDRFDEAISTWKIVIHLDVADADAACNIASALVTKGEHVTAVAWFREAARRQPKRTEFHFYLGKALAEIGDQAGARAAWEKALTLDDEYYAKAARQALQENPLPNEASQE